MRIRYLFLTGLLAWPACSGSGDPAGGPPTGDPGMDGEPDPGRVVLHRLNRAEYDNTVRDLLGTDLTPAQAFPPDDFGEGFDNIAAVLSLSPLHIEMYELAADELIADALAVDIVQPVLRRVEAESDEAVPTAGGATGDGWNIWSNGTLEASFSIETPGRYRLSVRAYGHQAGDELPRMALRMDGEEVAYEDVDAEQAAPAVYSVEVELAAGGHSGGAGFLNDFNDPDAGLDRNLIVDWIELEGPLGLETEPPPNRGKVFTCSPDDLGEEACAREIIAGFGKRARRRPPGPDEVDRHMALYEAARAGGGTWDDGVLGAVKALLVSPHFLFRVELDPDPDSTTPGPVSAWELASRLSYFLWSSMPDDELFALAEDGSLLEPEVIEAQVRRMLADPKAEALIQNFAGQWLYIRAVDNAAPDYNVYPDWDDELRASMKEEMRRLTRDILLGDRSMLDLLTADETWIDARLAAHYGLPAPEGDEWARVSLDSTARTGLLTTGGLLAALSYPTRTSPVKRGKWVLDQLLCLPPPPPPPDIDIPPPDPEAAETMREQMERHRSDPACKGCHATMDPIGFGLERFDATGRHREIDATGSPIDASGTLPGDISFDGAVELAAELSRDERVPRCMVQQTLTYALGRAVTYTDRAYVDEIEARFAAGEYRFEELAVNTALSDPFRYRRGEPLEEGSAAAASPQGAVR